MEDDVETGRELQLVETAHVLRLRDRDLDRLAVARERDRAHALEHGERDQLGRARVDTGDREVDEREVVLLGERPGDAQRAREALLDERVRERAAARTY